MTVCADYSCIVVLHNSCAILVFRDYRYQSELIYFLVYTFPVPVNCVVLELISSIRWAEKPNNEISSWAGLRKISKWDLREFDQCKVNYFYNLVGALIL